MTDETSTPSTNELEDFARSFTADEPEVTPAETPVGEIPPVETAVVETPPVETPPVVKEDENPFEVDKKDDPKPEDAKEPEKPTSSDDWSRLRESRNNYKAQVAEKESILREKEAEVTELKTKAARTVELEEKLKVFDEQEKELALVRVESTIEYKNSIEAPLKVIGEQVGILTTSNEGDIFAVKQMLVEADPAKQRIMLKEITSGWDEIDRIDLKKMAEDARTILDKQDRMRENAHAASKEQEKIASQRDAESKETVKKEFTKVTGDVVKSLRDKLPFVALADGETENDRYSVLEQKVARVDFDALPPKAKALAAASTFALTHAIKTIGVKDTEITSLKEALAKALGSKPSVGPRADAAAESGEKDFFAEFGIPEPKFGMR